MASTPIVTGHCPKCDQKGFIVPELAKDGVDFYRCYTCPGVAWSHGESLNEVEDPSQVDRPVLGDVCIKCHQWTKADKRVALPDLPIGVCNYTCRVCPDSRWQYNWNTKERTIVETADEAKQPDIP